MPIKKEEARRFPYKEAIARLRQLGEMDSLHANSAEKRGDVESAEFYRARSAGYFTAARTLQEEEE